MYLLFVMNMCEINCFQFAAEKVTLIWLVSPTEYECEQTNVHTHIYFFKWSHAIDLYCFSI